nr:COX assembly mitochondrial protein homolog [Vicugna pacos]
MSEDTPGRHLRDDDQTSRVAPVYFTDAENVKLEIQEQVPYPLETFCPVAACLQLLPQAQQEAFSGRKRRFGPRMLASPPPSSPQAKTDGSWSTPRSVFAGSYGKCIFDLIRKSPVIFQGGCTTGCPPPPAMQERSSYSAFFLALEQHLRHVEKDVLIPKIMREKARERCSEQVQEFTKCCKDSGVLMVVKCQKENSALKECLTAYYNDPAFYEECKMEYLKEREEFRKTGIPSKRRLQKLPTSM